MKYDESRLTIRISRARKFVVVFKMAAVVSFTITMLVIVKH